MDYSIAKLQTNSFPRVEWTGTRFQSYSHAKQYIESIMLSMKPGSYIPIPHRPDHLAIYTTTHKEASLQCKICQKPFSTNFARKRHEINVHSSKIPCEYCGELLKTTGRRDAELRHINRCKKANKKYKPLSVSIYK